MVRDWENNFVPLQGKKLPSSDAQDGYVTDEDEGAAGQEKNKKGNKKEGSTKRHKLAKELSDLVNYFKSVRFEDFQVSQSKRKLIQWFYSARSFLLMSPPNVYVTSTDIFLSTSLAVISSLKD